MRFVDAVIAAMVPSLWRATQKLKATKIHVFEWQSENDLVSDSESL